MSISNQEIQERIIKTMKVMLSVRGIPEYSIVDTLTQQTDIVLLIDSLEIKVFLTFVKMGKERITNFLKTIEDYKSMKIIFISKIDLTVQAKKLLWNSIELFLTSQVCINILSHKLQPSFTLLTSSETKTLITNLQCSLNSLPKISSFDPVSRFFGAQPKDVFKIERPNNIYYRVVI